MLLRTRQKELVGNAVIAMEDRGNTLAVAPTGAGKTVMLSAVVGDLLRRGAEKACVLAHRDELTAQNRAKFMLVNPGVSTGVYDGTIKRWDAAVTFAMAQTLSRKAGLASMPRLDVLVIDEAHHARADGYRRIIDRARALNPRLMLLGMTATPNRGDKLGLRPVFDNVADQINIKELIASGHLVPPRTFVIDAAGSFDDLTKVKKKAGEFDQKEVAAIMNRTPVTEEVIRHWKEKAGDRRTVVFCSTVNHAADVAASFRAAGVSAAAISGNMSKADRERTLADYAAGRVQVIVNVAVLTEGWDHPPTSCVVLLRLASHKSTMTQMVGRGLRTVDPNEWPGIVKRDCVVLDFGTASMVHGSLETEADLDDKPKDKRSEPKKDCPECGGSVPARASECVLCGYEWPSGKKPDMSGKLAKFDMAEINLLDRSDFLWEEPHCGSDSVMVSGFKAWACVKPGGGVWHAVGGLSEDRDDVRLLAVGERVSCLAAADDWMNAHETEESARKTMGWHGLPPTDKQTELLARIGMDSDSESMTRYKASLCLTEKFNRKKIDAAILSNAAPRQ